MKKALDDLLVSLQTDYPAMGSEQHHLLVAAAEGIAKVVGGDIRYTGSEIRFDGPLHIDLFLEYAELFINGFMDYYYFTYAELQKICKIAGMCSLAVEADPELFSHAQNVEYEEKLVQLVLDNEANKGESNE